MAEPKEQLQRLLRMAQRQLAKTDPIAYIEYVFGVELAAHHKEMIAFARDIIETKRSGLILAPRGSGKTTVLNTGLMSWLIATMLGIRIALLSQKAEKAEAMSMAIMNTISETPESIEVFGNLRGPWKWTASEWLRKDSPHFKTKDRTVVAAGADQSSGVVSKRFDLILADDVLDENNTYTPERREKIETWFWKTLKPTQAAEGCAVLVIGTRWVADDLYERLETGNKWPTLRIPAIDTDPKTGEDVSYWPSVWPLSRLYAEREDVGWDNFACSYLNKIDATGDGIFQRDWWRETYFAELPSDRTFVFTMGVDLASSERERADYTTLAIVAEDNLHEHWVLHTARVKTESGHRAFVGTGVDWAASHGYPLSRIIVETNQHQSTFVQDLLKETTWPVVGKRTDTDKRTRARAAAARYESHRVHHHIELRGKELETELLSFPKGHDDLIDALGLAMDLGGSTGAFAAAGAREQEPTAVVSPLPIGPSEVVFADGNQVLPEHVVRMLDGIDTERLTLEEAMSMANARRMTAFLQSAINGIIPRG